MKLATYRPYGIGFDRFFDEVESILRENSNVYPPHNVVKTGEDIYEIELALAGFEISDLHIETIENSLVITGEKKDEDLREYIHKGISARKFVRKFSLAEHVIVKDAKLKNGILNISLERIIPEEKKPRTISINSELDAIDVPKVKTKK